MMVDLVEFSIRCLVFRLHNILSIFFLMIFNQVFWCWEFKTTTCGLNTGTKSPHWHLHSSSNIWAFFQLNFRWHKYILQHWKHGTRMDAGENISCRWIEVTLFPQLWIWAPQNPNANERPWVESVPDYRGCSWYGKFWEVDSKQREQIV